MSTQQHGKLTPKSVSSAAEAGSATRGQAQAPLRMVQLRRGRERRVARVAGGRLELLPLRYDSIHRIACEALAAGRPVARELADCAFQESLDYEEVYSGLSVWRLLPPLDHPEEPARCLVSGTGLTHLGSAKDRQAMHSIAESDLSDSMKMFRWGMEAGRPEQGKMGIAPEWFYKGNGLVLRACGEPLDIPGYAEGGGEEAEIAGLYLVGPDGRIHRLGMAIGNEFSDHRFEKRNYLNLAGSKIRTCAVGPEMVIGADFSHVRGRVSIERAGDILWSQEIETGENAMCHSLANIEHHHFKFELHRRPGDVHVHFFGAHSLSFGMGIRLTDGDRIEVDFPGFGRPLRNFVRASGQSAGLVSVVVEALG